MGTIEKRGKNSWRVGVQVQTERGWEWVRRTIKMPQGMSEARQNKKSGALGHYRSRKEAHRPTTKASLR